MKTYVIMLAGGRGSRMNAGFNKVLMSVRGRTVIRRSVEADLHSHSEGHLFHVFVQ